MEEASSSQLIEKIDPDPPRPPKPKTVYFASEGDTHLFLSSPNSLDNEPRIVIFVVSSHAMAPVCDAWAHMVMRHVDRCKLEAETVENVGSAADGAVAFVPLPDDDPDGLEVLLNIAHLRFDRVPEKLKFKRLLAVAVLMEKYGVTQMVRPWWQRWLAAVKDKANVPGYEELLYIAWAFGEEKMLKSGVDHLIRSVRLDEEERLVTPKGVILDFSNENKHFPPYIEEVVRKGRSAAVDLLLKRCYKLVDKFFESRAKGGYCCQDTSDEEERDDEHCDSVILGSLLLSLQDFELGPERKTCKNISWSVDKLIATLQILEVVTIHGQTCDGGCDSFRKFVDKFSKAGYKRMAPDSDSPWKAHMDRKKIELTGRLELPNEISLENGLKRKRESEG